MNRLTFTVDVDHREPDDYPCVLSGIAGEKLMVIYTPSSFVDFAKAAKPELVLISGGKKTAMPLLAAIQRSINPRLRSYADVVGAVRAAAGLWKMAKETVEEMRLTDRARPDLDGMPALYSLLKQVLPASPVYLRSIGLKPRRRKS